MDIQSAKFLSSSIDLNACPCPKKPEFAFTGRSNVGKSSLINLLTHRKSLAKTSGTPGKTQTINHFLINEMWYLVDVPGYGYAKTSRHTQKSWQPMLENYLLKRKNLYCVFVLLDARHVPLAIDLSFLAWLGSRQKPLAVLLTKTDKLSTQELSFSKTRLQEGLYKDWEQLPPILSTSAKKKKGREDVLNFIEKAIKN